MSAVIVDHITKTFNKGKITALDDVSFTVREGELFGLIGPDGAGKTTLFRILTTLWLADSGKASVKGLDVVHDYKTIRKRIGYMPGKFSLYQDLTVEENLGFFATLFNTTIRENYDLVKDIYVQLEPFKDRKAGKLSGGMKQKLALCCALIHKPDVLFLDEPTTGVDPVSRKEFWEMLRRLQSKITIVVSTPYMDEANLCDRIALMQDGRIMQLDTPVGIVRAFSDSLLSVKGNDMFGLISAIRSLPGISGCYGFGESLHVRFPEGEWSIEGFKAELQSFSGLKIEPITPGIEDCFMALMEPHAVN